MTGPAFILEAGRAQLSDLDLADVGTHVLKYTHVATIIAVRYEVEVHRHSADSTPDARIPGCLLL
jgi:hypothetical protein